MSAFKAQGKHIVYIVINLSGIQIILPSLFSKNQRGKGGFGDLFHPPCLQRG